jgi:hypothetical protein
MTDSLIALSPLKVLVVTEKPICDGTERATYSSAISRALQGGIVQSPDGADRYYAAGDDLGVDVPRLAFNTLSESGVADPDVELMLRSCGFLLVVVLLEGEVTSRSRLGKWLSHVAELALSDEFEGRIGILPIALDTASERITLKHFGGFQRLSITQLGEYALRPAHLGLLVLQQAWLLLVGDPPKRLKLFVSHAKLDGAPIALSLKAYIESLPWLQRFYDANDILPGTQWQRVLQRGVQDSIVVMLRTDIYEQRVWCLQEVAWAEEFGCPAVVVDARQSLTMPRETLPAIDLASVRVPDGNLIRILNAALREAVRLRLFDSSVQLLQQTQALPDGRTLIVPRVSLSSLGLACEKRTKSKKGVDHVIVPERFREALRPIAERLVKAYFPKADLGIPSDFV